MKLVWKCDFCSETSPAPSTTSAHEAGCGFNPANRRCIACAHSDHGERCTKHGIDFYLAVEDGEAECPDWSYDR